MKCRLPRSRKALQCPVTKLPATTRWLQHSTSSTTGHKRTTPLSRIDKILKEQRGSEKLKQDVKIKEPRIAVLGGGISGLATAYFLAKKFPNLPITLFESSNRLGGWLQSKRVEVEGGSVLFEQGPRTLRTESGAGLVTLKIVEDLALVDEMVALSKNAPAALNRYVYYPNRLVRMPNPRLGFVNGVIWPMLTSSLFSGVASGFLHEYRTPARPAHIQDESIADWFTRRFGSPKLAVNLISALLHGVYAGNVHKLSTKSISPTLWEIDGEGSFLFQAAVQVAEKKKNVLPPGSFRGREKAFTQEMKDQLPAGLVQLAKDTSVYSFKGGISTLSNALENKLRANPNVDIQLGVKLKSLVYDPANDGITIESTSTKSNTKTTYLQTISTISAPTLSSLLPSSTPIPTLTATHAVTVMVVNLYFRSPPSVLLPSTSFGYLLPYSLPRAQNPEYALGVIFDSYATPVSEDINAGPQGARLTVMLGGHWWDSLTPSEFPSREHGLELARQVIARHLKIKEEPEQWCCNLNRECIPQPTVGHWERMRKGGEDLERGFGGRLAVLGPWYKGVGVNDCVRSAYECVEKLGNEGEAGNGVMGLEGYAEL